MDAIAKVRLELVLWLNPIRNLKKERRHARATRGEMPLWFRFQEVAVPSGVRQGGVAPAVYNAYREGLDSACADIVITTRLPSGSAAVIASQRAPEKPFGGKWWMQGGAIHAYRPIYDFLLERAHKECGVRPEIEGVIGFFRTCAEGGIASTIQPCYVGFVEVERLKLNEDQDHAATRLLTLRDLGCLPTQEQHPYPMLVFEHALRSMPD